MKFLYYVKKEQSVVSSLPVFLKNIVFENCIVWCIPLSGVFHCLVYCCCMFVNFIFSKDGLNKAIFFLRKHDAVKNKVWILFLYLTLIYFYLATFITSTAASHLAHCLISLKDLPK